MRANAPRTARLAASLLALAGLAGCTRFEEHVLLSEHTPPDWKLTWTTIARRGINLVDSGGNVGSASATFRARPHPVEAGVYLVAGAPVAASASGAASDLADEIEGREWSGSVRLEARGDARVLVLDLRDGDGRPFVGNRSYEHVSGRAGFWFAR